MTAAAASPRAPAGPDGTSGTTVELAYRRTPLLIDYARGLIGLALGTAPLVLLQPPLVLRLFLALLVLLFALFLLQTWRRQRMVVQLSATGIGPAGRDGRELAWRDLDRLRLRWYGPRGGGGWLELQLRGGGRRLRLISTLAGFDRVVAEAADAAARNRLRLDPVTDVNLACLIRLSG